MTHQDAPPRTEFQEHCEAFWTKLLERTGSNVSWGRDKDGNYLSMFAASAWAAWEAAGRSYSMKLAEVQGFISVQRAVISDLLNVLEQLRQHIEDGETDEALALIESRQERARGSVQ